MYRNGLETAKSISEVFKDTPLATYVVCCRHPLTHSLIHLLTGAMIDGHSGS